MKEAILYEKVGNAIVRCNLCERRCRIPPETTGFCRVRKNLNGTLYSLVYGRIVAANVDPVEKKPLFHFYPGSTAFSIATVGCNFRCQFCCNSDSSQSTEIWGEELNPGDVMTRALRSGSTVVSYTYTEPTVFMEFALDTAKAAKEKGLKNTFVTNGYMTPEAIETISPYLDAATVDLKANGNSHFYSKYMGVPETTPIYNSLKALRAMGVHIEITDLIVPQLGDNMDDLKRLATWIADSLGQDVPMHILSFYPNYAMSDLPATPLNTIERGISVCKGTGLRYVYGGNVPGHPSESTVCPSCSEVLIKRVGFAVMGSRLTPDNRCPRCGETIGIVGQVTLAPVW